MTTTVITHIWNEQYILPWFVAHHAPMFDAGIVIDYASTDRSLAIINELAPHWKIIQSRNPHFDAVACDEEVMDIERSIDGWKIALTATEFLYCQNLSAWIDVLDAPAARIKPVAIVDTVGKSADSTAPLHEQYHNGFFGGYMEPYKGRLIHRHPDGQYLPGRHEYRHKDVALYPDGALIAWYGWAPWTAELIARKLQIQKRIPDTDKQMGFGGQHMITEEQLHAKRQELIAQSCDLREFPEYMTAVG